MSYHVGRHWDGPGELKENCPCPKEPCGLVDVSKADPECLQHPLGRCKTMRSGHRAETCGNDLATETRKS